MSDLSGKKKAHKHKLFGPVALGTTPGLSPGANWGLSLGFVPGKNPGLLLILHTGSPVCLRDEPSLSLGQFRGRRVAEKVYVSKVYVPFSPANLSQVVGRTPRDTAVLAGKSKRGLSKRGFGPKGTNRAKKGPFRATSVVTTRL